MSVAFRRDSDEEHLEPRFELPIPPGPNLVTTHGYKLIEARTESLEAALAEATSDERRADLQRDLRYWRVRLATAQVPAPPSGDAVAFGTRVTIEQDGRTRTLTIVGHDEADPPAGAIAFSSPLAQALMGAEPGDEVCLPGRDDPVLRDVGRAGLASPPGAAAFQVIVRRVRARKRLHGQIFGGQFKLVPHRVALSAAYVLAFPIG